MRGLAIGLCTLLAPAAFAQDATCEDQAAYLLEAMPGWSSEDGFRTASELVQNDVRLLVAVTGFAAAADVLGERAVDRGLPREYWLGLLVVSHGLLDCFEDATEGLSENQLASLEQFDDIYPPDLRTTFAAQAMVELGMFGERQ